MRSLYKNVESLKDFLNYSEIDFGVIGLVETWLKDEPQDYLKLNGYSLEYTNRVNKTGGGVCLYVKNNVKYHVRKDLNEIKQPDNVETMLLKLKGLVRKILLLVFCIVHLIKI